MAEALYRKYRPQIFEDVVGQEHIERTIKNAIEQDKVSHAYLFTGPRGTGKTTTARLLAKALLCECGPTSEPDGTCDDCVMIANGEHPDVYELDAASRTGVENVREEIIGRVQFAPTRGRYKIYIIDEVHMLSTAAFNALLKTLEEPPSHVVFILATTDPQKVPETIHSRCQRFDFRRISAESIVSRLGAICVSEDVEFEGEALDLIAHRAEGGMRNALTSLEQLIAFGEGKVTMEVAERLLGSIDTNDLAEIVRAIGTRDVASCFRWTAEYVETGADLAQFVRDLAEHMRNMYVLSLAGADVALEVSETVRRELASELPLFGPDRLARLLGVLGDLSAELKTSTNPRLSFEIALTRMVRPDSDLTLEALAERIEALESGHSAVAHVIGGGAAAVAAPQVAAASAPQVSVAPAPASPPASPATQGAPMPASQPSAAPASAPGPDRASSAERAGAVPAAPVQPVAAPQVAAPSREAGGVPPQGAEGVSAPRPASPVTQSQAPSAAAPSDQLKASLQNPAALQRVWQAVLATLKKNKAAYGVLFLNTKAVYDAGKDTLIIEFPAENSFAFKAVQKPDVQEAVSVALNQACGESLHFAYAQGGAVATAAAPAARPAPSPTPRPTPAPAQRPQQPQQAAPAVSAPAPRPKPVPDYDIPPYEDEVVPYDDGYVSSAPTPAPAPDPASAPTPAAVPAPAAPAPVDARTSATPEPAVQQSPEELQAILAAGFGDGVRVEEVRE
ncbi:DNA polymerase III subunit gamma/tau [Eggerthella lenta]|uniref:DNA polymerase III subunit gamma/tau n=1 Tax=Eggerthella lenta TaxID=84112 RepID=UPI00232BF1C2|nr:DNA polymerase III subunit gamma/tau [Eggerthella lenta]MDB1776941.1 DNA polymerase III subunit gamma/tau [Eggerthella lenta]MDB1785583.1 DNA polymerase III subunit gamma/tau [Eggerthella lenta]MDB1791546.1 DNA polymerase III subunit gamma/tau [Eggerthella lenta]